VPLGAALHHLFAEREAHALAAYHVRVVPLDMLSCPLTALVTVWPMRSLILDDASLASRPIR
jgi:hypothetical protein